MNKSHATVFFPMPSEVCECYSNSLFPDSHSCCSAERAHEEFVKVNPYDHWGRFMGSCVSHLLLFHPRSGPVPHSSPCTLPPNTHTRLLVFPFCATAEKRKEKNLKVAFHLSTVLHIFSLLVRDDRNSKPDDSLHPSLFRHQVLLTSICAYGKI